MNPLPSWATAHLLKPKIKQFFEKNGCKLLALKCLDLQEKEVDIYSKVLGTNASIDNGNYNNSSKC